METIRNGLLFLFDKWHISATLFGITILFSILLTIFPKLGKKLTLKPNIILFVGTFFSAVFYFLPMYRTKLTSTQAFFHSLQYAFRLFSLDGDFTENIVKFDAFPVGEENFHITYGSMLYLFAPILTFGFILTFFKNFLAHLKYISCFWANTHVFSELNEKSLALAKSLTEQKSKFRFWQKNLIVFTDIIDKKEELNLDLMEYAKEIGAILFRKDLESVCFKRSLSFRRVNFYLISEDEEEKIRHTQAILKRYDLKKVSLRIFSDDVRIGLLLNAKPLQHIEVQRINDIQMLIYHELYQNGINLFETARKPEEKDADSIISVVLVGLGKYGQEMLKGLTWFCQMKGYRLKINAFDADEKAEEKFKCLCPELMSPDYNGCKKDGEPYYKINIHSGVDVAIPSFEKHLQEINDATFFFISLGDDETNLRTAVHIRSICERISYTPTEKKPVIETVIYNSDVCERMGISWEHLCGVGTYDCAGMKNHRNTPYNILMIGDLKHFYSTETLINSELEQAGFQMHKNYCIESQKISFTEDRMQSEWDAFLEEFRLTQAWDEHLQAVKIKAEKEELKKSKQRTLAEQETIQQWKNQQILTARWNNFLGIDTPQAEQPSFDKKSTSEKKTPSLSAQINGFSFLTCEETKQKQEGKLSKKDAGNLVADRADIWEKRVYIYFSEHIENAKSPIADLWKKTEKAETASAKKTFLTEYNRLSSITKAIHRRLRLDPRMPQTIVDNAWDKLSVTEKVEMGKIEHIRWNAYMRTEGYCFAEKRNDLAKRHHNLVPVSDLSNDDLRKDA